MKFGMRPIALIAALAGGCAFNIDGLPITAPGGEDQGMPDLAVGGADLASSDLAANGDLAGPNDLSMADLTAPPGSDLSGAPDLLLPGQLTGTLTIQAAGDINLTVEGTADWSHWGLAMATDWDRKLTGASQISNVGNIAGGAITQKGGYPVSASWNDGTPTMSATASGTGIYIFGVGQGFRITAPAGPTVRTLRIYCGGQQATAKVLAHLSDGSAADYTATTTYNTALGDSSTMQQFNRVITLVYNSSLQGQTLTVDWTVQTGSYVHFMSATLQ
jgi:hypothetical protein